MGKHIESISQWLLAVLTAISIFYLSISFKKYIDSILNENIKESEAKIKTIIFKVYIREVDQHFIIHTLSLGPDHRGWRSGYGNHE